MKTVYRFIKFACHPDIPDVWVCYSKSQNVPLGGCEWYAPWKQFVFSADMSSLFSHDCLNDISDFLRQLNAAKKQEGKK